MPVSRSFPLPSGLGGLVSSVPRGATAQVGAAGPDQGVDGHEGVQCFASLLNEPFTLA